MPSRISESKEKEIISLYVEEFMDGGSVAKRVGVHAGTVYNVLARNGIETRHPESYRTVNKLNKIKLLYNRGNTIDEVASMVDLHPGTVGRLMRENNIETRPSYITLRSVWWDEQFFKRESKITAYWCGFLMADGNISFASKAATHRVSLTLAEKDKDHLVKYCQDVQIPIKHIRYNHGTKSNSVGITGDESSTAIPLKKWGVIPRKSYVYQEPKILNQELILPYIVGIIDGDGYIRVGKKNNEITIACNKDFAPWLIENLRLFDTTFNKISIYNGTDYMKVVRFGSKKTMTGIYNQVIDMGIPYLSRKWDKIRDLA